MAKDAKPAENAAEGAPPKKNKKILIIAAAAIFALVLIGGGAAFFLLKKGDPAEEDEEATEDAPKKKDKKKKKDGHGTPVFANLEAFTVNLVPESGEQYLQVALAIELDDPAGDLAMKSAMPKIRNNITLLLSSKKASELYSKEGKTRLAEELKNEINVAIEPPTRNRKGELVMPEGPAKAVLFTSFIIQ